MQKLQLKKEYQKYSEYKNPGVDWLGEIPKEWEVNKGKNLMAKIASGVWGEDAKGDENDFPCLRVADFKYDKLSFRKIETIRNIPKNQQHKILKNNSVLIEKSGGGEKQLVGRAILFNSDQEMVCANFIDSIEVNDETDPKYFTYLLANAYDVRLNLKSIKQNTGIQNLDTKNYFSEMFPKPPKQDQQKIAKFLDEKVGLIDEIVKKKKRLIELLKEKRTAVINQAVTKGLDPNVEMKDSGVEWIGEIPKGWKMRKISRSFGIIGSGTTPSSMDESLYDEGDINWVITGNLNNGILNETSKKITKKAFSESSTLKIYPVGTLLIAMYGATIGKLAILGIPACTNQACCALADSKYFINKFIYYWFLSNKKSIIDNFSYGGGQPNISQNVIKELKIQSPDPKEQCEIIKCLDGEINRMSLIMKKVEKSINLLTEFKSSLISNVVTGKVKI
jgi:type I restriction enzyme S subunit